MTWLRRTFLNAVWFEARLDRLAAAAPNAASLGAKTVTPCLKLMGSSRPADSSADWKAVRFQKSSAAVNSPGTSMTALTVWMVRLPTVVELTTVTSTRVLREKEMLTSH